MKTTRNYLFSLTAAALAPVAPGILISQHNLILQILEHGHTKFIIKYEEQGVVSNHARWNRKEIMDLRKNNCPFITIITTKLKC